MNLSSNSADKDVGVTLQALPTREGIMMGLLLFKPGNAVIEEIKTTEEAREFFAKQFPQFLPHIDSAELERFAERPVSKLPVRRPSPPPPSARLPLEREKFGRLEIPGRILAKRSSGCLMQLVPLPPGVPELRAHAPPRPKHCSGGRLHPHGQALLWHGGEQRL